MECDHPPSQLQQINKPGTAVCVKCGERVTCTHHVTLVKGGELIDECRGCGEIFWASTSLSSSSETTRAISA